MYSEFATTWYRFRSPYRNSELYPKEVRRHRCASTHFGENQLAPNSIGISPLTITHPPIFQHRSVRTSTWCYPSFILVVVRSSGFGSIRSDVTPYSDSLSLGLRMKLLNPATSYKSPAHSSTGTRSGPMPSHCLSADGFMFYFTPLRGFFSPFPRGTISLSVTQEYLALRGGPRRFTRDSTCPMLLGISLSINDT